MDLTLGTVKENYDKDHPGMLLVTIPTFDKSGGDTAWLPAAAPYAGKDYGFYVLPEKDEQVIIGFLDGDRHAGVVIGSLWNRKNTHPPKTVTEKNEVRAFVTKGGHSIIIKDGDEGGVTVKTKAGHTISIAEKDKKISVLTSDGKETITLDEGGGELSVNADKKISLKAQEITIEGNISGKGRAISLEADGNLDLKGKQIKIDGSAAKMNSQNTELTGMAVKVESNGILTLKGAMTKIN
ncbi:MAG: phage baseplate assembly protein V [Clostridiales Family XIII bacterium]|jgi:uncharacterized protein involved in type VI secretion and phage assembly|nr:phage baseplate assembly protein V [Clostridiales Family XIII bacterium]